MSAWTLDEKALERFFEPILPKYHVEGLVDIIRQVIRESPAAKPLDYKSSIVERALGHGIIESEYGQHWLTAALRSGLRPDVNSGFVGEGEEIFEARHRDNWRSLSKDGTAENREWLQRVAENSEDKDFLEREIETTGHENEENQKRSLFLRCLHAAQISSPVVNYSESVIAHLTQFSEMDLSQQTKDFVDYSIARNAAVTGQSELAIQTYYRLKNSRSFRPERQIDIRYHMINASYALRRYTSYGKPEVSTTLKLAPEGDETLQERLNKELLGGFDARAEISNFCEDFDIDAERVSQSSVSEYVRRFNGPNGAKIIYFYHLEEILRTNRHERSKISEHYEEIVRMLKLLSDTARQGEHNSNFTKDAWYPLVLLHSVAANLDHFELAERIEKEILSFDGWKHGSKLRADVQQETRDGSFLTLLHTLNRELVTAKRKGKANLSSELRGLHKQFGHIRFMPALSQNVMAGIKALGDAYEWRQDVTALATRVVSHWNYMVGGGTFDFRRHIGN